MWCIGEGGRGGRGVMVLHLFPPTVSRVSKVRTLFGVYRTRTSPERPD